MHPMLMTHIAQEDVAERLRSIERERLARMARSARKPRSGGPLGSLARFGEALSRHVAALRAPHRPAGHRPSTVPCVEVDRR